MFNSKEEIEKVLFALSEQLNALNAGNYELLVCGGAALNILGYVLRTTEDIDVIAFVERNANETIFTQKIVSFDSKIIEASSRVGKDFNLPDNWLNSGPAKIMDFGLPNGLMKRVETRSYGKNLTIHFLTRYDQIHFKLYAAVDQGGRHYDDLIALNPSAKELESAARWSMTHDPSEGYKVVLKDLLIKMGYKNVAEKL